MADYLGLLNTETPTNSFLWNEDIDLLVNGGGDNNNNAGDNNSSAAAVVAAAANYLLTSLNLTSSGVFSHNASGGEEENAFAGNGSLGLAGNCTRPSTDISEKPTLRMLLEIQRWIGPPILVFGILTNILTLLTLQGMELSPYVHLSWLAIADLSGLVLMLVDHFNDPFDRRWMLFRVYVYYPLGNLAAIMGVWIMVLVTLERCIFIRYMMAPLWCTPSRARAKVLAVFLVCFVLNGPRFFWFKVKLHKQGGGSVRSHCPPQYRIFPYLQEWSGAKAMTWVYSALSTFLPLCLLMAFNGFLIYNVHARRRLRPSLGVADTSDTVWSSEQSRFTLTVIAIVGLFIILVMPSAFSHPNILHPLLGVDRPTEAVHVFQNIANFLMWLSMSINFLMYTAINTRFQEAFKAMYRGWLVSLGCRKRDTRSLHHHYYHHHHHHHHYHHHHHHHNNGFRPKLSLRVNGAGGRNGRDQTAVDKAAIRFRQEGNSRSDGFDGPLGRGAGEQTSWQRKLKTFRALFSFTSMSSAQNRTREEILPLQPSIRSCSTGTSGSSSQSPTEATEFCPMLSVGLVLPAKITETDSLSLVTATPVSLQGDDDDVIITSTENGCADEEADVFAEDLHHRGSDTKNSTVDVRLVISTAESNQASKDAVETSLGHDSGPENAEAGLQPERVHVSTTVVELGPADCATEPEEYNLEPQSVHSCETDKDIVGD